MTKKDFLRTIITGNENIINPGDVSPTDLKLDLSVGTNNFATAIQRRLGSRHEHREIEKMGNLLLNEISRRIDDGEQIAFLNRNKDGTLKLTTFSISDDEG